MNTRRQKLLGVTLGSVYQTEDTRKPKKKYMKRESWRLGYERVRKEVKCAMGRGRKATTVMSRITNWYTC